MIFCGPPHPPPPLSVSHFRANLSDHYFTQRQDRYLLIKNQVVSDFFAELVSTVASFSYELQVLERDEDQHDIKRRRKKERKRGGGRERRGVCAPCFKFVTTASIVLPASPPTSSPPLLLLLLFSLLPLSPLLLLLC